ncbi:MAG: SBBP repeat-containing protein [Flavobacteriales bacterium]|nr:SBBP repeat-containing protein [Flavobacteriales bacterium]MCW8911767.1 SBBP repeat-containing protein [Flavobacteriales bacterium]MCW8937026.1 SBBP repeat-containing protein [Flavobacteriales bacterium]MCW8939255.1 SBBP repeat-containing protein [Flavobacteriales bacterium]MCW8968971.1 SBBP repeat-containing protein [Flavobacteriales bacterium]
MKTTTLVTLIATILTVGINAQTLEWAKSFGGQNFDAGRSIAIDSLENVYITGSFSDTADFDPGIGTYNLISKGNHDIFISKLDASGNFVWAKQIGGLSGGQSNSIIIDAAENVYTTGFFGSTVDFDPGSGTYNLTSVGTTDIFISKLNASGDFVWAKHMGGVGVSIGNKISLDVSGNIYTIGSFQDTVDFDPNSGISNLIAAGSWDVFVQKMSQTISEIRENFNDSQIRFYPNPTNGLIHITFESEPSQVQIIVRNIMGQELYRKKHSATKHIDLILDGPAGVYLIEVSTVNKRALLKVIKE